ncbi:MAG: AraC family transcriptional regulator [Silanimonas sp.]
MKTTKHYDARVQAVVAAVADALENGRELPDLAELATRAHFSPFHFHRLWRALTGETVGGTVLRLRLLRAIDLLADDSRSITDIALAVGFGSSQALARVVRERLATTPSALRDATARDAARAALAANPPMTHAPCRVEVVSLSPFRALLQRAVGGDEAVAAAFGALFEKAALEGLLEHVAGLWGIDWDDRRDVDESECRADCLLAITDAAVATSTTHCGGGRYARMQVTGSYAGLEPAIDTLLADWLPSSGERLRDAPILLNYLDDPETTPEAALRTDILLPLEG